METAAGVEDPESPPWYQQRRTHCEAIFNCRGSRRSLRGGSCRQRKALPEGSPQVDKGAYLDGLPGSNRPTKSYGAGTRIVPCSGHHHEGVASAQQESWGEDPLGIGIRWSQGKQAGSKGGSGGPGSQQMSSPVHRTDTH